jgi:hypothetical protein
MHTSGFEGFCSTSFFSILLDFLPNSTVLTNNFITLSKSTHSLDNCNNTCLKNYFAASVEFCAISSSYLRLISERRIDSVTISPDIEVLIWNYLNGIPLLI